jgi:hypothetical protein
MFSNLRMAATIKKNIIAIASLTNILEVMVGFLAMFIILSFLQCSTARP